jgi:hypothetical protein
MMFREVIVLYCEDHTKHINTFFEGNERVFGCWRNCYTCMWFPQWIKVLSLLLSYCFNCTSRIVGTKHLLLKTTTISFSRRWKPKICPWDLYKKMYLSFIWDRVNVVVDFFGVMLGGLLYLDMKWLLNWKLQLFWDPFKSDETHDISWSGRMSL